MRLKTFWFAIACKILLIGMATNFLPGVVCNETKERKTMCFSKIQPKWDRPPRHIRIEMGIGSIEYNYGRENQLHVCDCVFNRVNSFSDISNVSFFLEHDIGDISLKFIDKKHVLVVVEVLSQNAMETLWRAYKSGDLNNRFQKDIITDAIKTNLHASTITVATRIPKWQFKTTMRELELDNLSTGNGEVVLIISTEWWPRSGDISTSLVQRSLAKLFIRLEYAVYVTANQYSPQELEDAQRYGISLISPIIDDEPPRGSSTFFWLNQLHKYSDVYENVSIIITFARSQDEKADIQLTRNTFPPRTYSILVVTSSKHDSSHHETLEMYAATASAILTVGPSVGDFIIQEADYEGTGLQHISFIPEVDEHLFDIVVNNKGIKQGMKLCYVYAPQNNNVTEFDFLKFTMHNIANYVKQSQFNTTLSFNVGVVRETGNECWVKIRESFRNHVVVNLKYYSSQGNVCVIHQISNDLKACHLVVSTSVFYFDVIGLLATAVGIPFITTSASMFFEFLSINFPRHSMEWNQSKWAHNDGTDQGNEITRRVISLIDLDEYSYVRESAKLRSELKGYYESYQRRQQFADYLLMLKNTTRLYAGRRTALPFIIAEGSQEQKYRRNVYTLQYRQSNQDVFEDSIFASLVHLFMVLMTLIMVAWPKGTTSVEQSTRRRRDGKERQSERSGHRQSQQTIRSGKLNGKKRRRARNRRRKYQQATRPL